HLATATGEAQSLKAGGETETEKGLQHRVDAREVERLIADWPKAPQIAAKQMLEQYGPPNEATPTKLLWYRNGPWKRTLLTSDEVAHNFPMPHTDFSRSTSTIACRSTRSTRSRVLTAAAWSIAPAARRRRA
ncbi:MAG: hypothetical protein M3N04_02000, partial [Actinomycetota bacterium]|nr:hypothetical protein [Actinomycetota bacterium]